MNKPLQHIINQLRAEGKDYSNFKVLLAALRSSGADVSKDEILEFVANDYRIQLHTTPNSIAKLIAHLAKDSHCKSAIDICCGTGNILYYLQNEIDDLTGVEIAENVAELTKYFIPDLHIITSDSFLYPFQRKYDLVVGNIPFGMRIEMNGKRIPGEEAFLCKAHELLSENGKAIMLVPYSVLLSGQFHNFKNDFVNYLHEGIARPAGSIRNTQIKTALLVFRKQASNEIRLTQLQQFENLHQEFESAEHTIYSKEQLNKSWDPEYHLTRENSFYKELDNFQTKELQDLAEIIKGKMIPADKLKSKGDYLYLKPIHIKDNRLNLESGLKYVTIDDLREIDYISILQPGDIVISTIFNDLKMYVYQAGDEAAFASNNMAIIRSAKQDYILSYLQTEDGKRIFKTQAEDLKKGVAILHLSIKDLASIKIPILPFADLNAIGDVGISLSTEAQLRDALEQLSEYKNQVQALEKERESLATLKTFIDNRFDKVESQLELVNKKLDDLLSILKELKCMILS
jgi:type I restriction-modification system DNA methylase subunit